jgi:cytochrome c-type biogenesis protein CcmH/NrfG
VDSDSRLGLAWGFEVVPAVFMLDENGVEVDRDLGFDIRRPGSAARLEAFLARPAAAVGAGQAPESPAAAERRLASLPLSATRLRDRAMALLSLDRPAEAAALLEESLVRRNWDTKAWLAYASAQLRLGEKAKALDALRIALRLKPTDYLIRKQIWVIEHPEKFYPEIDWGWQREQIQREVSGR